MHNCLQYGHCSLGLFSPLEHFTQTSSTCIYPNLSPDGGIWFRGSVYCLLWSLRNNWRLKWEKCISDCNFLSFSFCYKCPLAYTSNRQLNICTRYSGTRKHVSSIFWWWLQAIYNLTHNRAFSIHNSEDYIIFIPDGFTIGLHLFEEL